MYPKIIILTVLDEFVIECTFNTGETLYCDLADFVIAGKGLSKQLQDKKYFAKAEIEEFGGIQWPNGLDLNGEEVYHTSSKKIPDRLSKKLRKIASESDIDTIITSIKEIIG